MRFTTRNNLTVVAITIFFFAILSQVNVTVGCSCMLNTKAPTCGSDGEIYPSLCHLHCERLYRPKMHAKKMEYCLHSHTCRWRCLKKRDPVCGSDMKTYKNLCFLKCNQERHPDLHAVKQGRCPKQRHAARKRNVSKHKRSKILI